jgi:hypothetical protein
VNGPLAHRSPFVYLVRAEFADHGEEDRWNRWYEAEHIPELMSVPGFLSATRFKELGHPHRYLAAYEISGPEVFTEPRYAEVAGWGEWAPWIVEWRRGTYRFVDPD